MSATQRLLMAFYFDIVPGGIAAGDLANESDTRCIACGQPASGRHGLPVNDSGEIIANTSHAFVGGQPACESCYRIHKSAGPHAVDVMREYVRAVRALHAELDARRALIKGVETLCAESTVR